MAVTDADTGICVKNTYETNRMTIEYGNNGCLPWGWVRLCLFFEVFAKQKRLSSIKIRVGECFPTISIDESVNEALTSSKTCQAHKQTIHMVSEPNDDKHRMHTNSTYRRYCCSTP